MRALVALVFVFGLGGRLSADEKLDEKFLVGKWTVKHIRDGADTGFKESFEFKADGTYLWDYGGFKLEGTYKLKDTTLELKAKNENTTSILKNLSVKDGKIIHDLGEKGRYNEWTRVKDKK
jgi:uncharacterized protein (TIGR03066 family)